MESPPAVPNPSNPPVKRPKLKMPKSSSTAATIWILLGLVMIFGSGIQMIRVSMKTDLHNAVMHSYNLATLVGGSLNVICGLGFLLFGIRVFSGEARIFGFASFVAICFSVLWTIGGAYLFYELQTTDSKQVKESSDLFMAMVGGLFFLAILQFIAALCSLKGRKLYVVWRKDKKERNKARKLRQKATQSK